MLKKLFSEGEGRKLLLCFTAFLIALVIFYFVEVKWYIELAVFGAIYLVIGFEHIVGSIKEFKEEPFNEDFLMVVASIGAFCLGEFADGTAVLLLFTLGEFFEEYAEERSENSIAALTALIPKTTTLIDGEREVEISVDDVKIGDALLLKAGDILPCDGEIIEGSSLIDNSALTGESLPISRLKGEFVQSGGVVKSGMIRVLAKVLPNESSAAKILELVKNSEEKKAGQEKFIRKFARVYTPIVLCLALLVALVPSFITGEWGKWVGRALNFLVVSCPCALVISVPLAFFAGIGKGFSKGVMIKGGLALEKLSKIKAMAFDKTGTVTDGSFSVKEIETDMEKEEFLRLVKIAESCSNHPIAKAIMDYKNEISFDAKGYSFDEISGKGIVAKTEKVRLYVGKRSFLEENGIKTPQILEDGTTVFVGKNEEYLGYLLIGDRVREGASSAILELKKQGLKTLMLTGDREEVATVVSKKVGIDEVYSNLLPEDKISALQKYAGANSTAFVGDGINDAPVLSSASVGISMGSGREVAIECADLVITDNDLGKIPFAVKLAKKTLRIVRQNVFFSIGAKGIVLLLSLFIGIPIWLAIFADVGVLILATLNSLRLS